MDMKEYASKDATALAALVKSGEVSADELTRTAQQALDVVDEKLNCRVRDLDAPISGAIDGPFAGVPFVIKDLVMHVVGVPQTMGTRLLAGDQFKTEHSSVLFERFQAAGLTTIARTATPEFGFNATTESVANGATRNPWNTAMSPGGSSGGSAAAVAAGVTPIGHANDGGGSIRIPAAACGLVGLKPSRGRTPLGPDYQLPLFGMGIEFAVTRSTRDAAKLLDCVAGPEVNSFVPLFNPKTPFAKGIEKPLKGLKIALAPNGFTDDVPIDPVMTDEVRRVGHMLSNIGHNVEEIDAIPLLAEQFAVANQRMWFSFCAAGVYGLTGAMGLSPDDTLFEACTLRAAEAGAKLNAPQMEEAMLLSAAISQHMGSFLAGYDAVVLPPCANPSTQLGILNQNNPDWSAEDFYDAIFSRFPCTAPFNMTGQPAISVPTGMADDMPVGVQIVANAAREDILLNLSAMLEQEINWTTRRPAVHASA